MGLGKALVLPARVTVYENEEPGAGWSPDAVAAVARQGGAYQGPGQ